MKYEITGTIERDTWAPGVWEAGVKCGDSISGLKFLGQTPQEAHDAAQRYCDEQNAKATEPKPPIGYQFADSHGVVDLKGYALVWNVEAGFCWAPPGDKLGRQCRWLVPAAPKRETREEAERRWKTYQVLNFEFAHYGSFMRGAGWEP